MRIGVISDIHGNLVALDAVLKDVETHPVDRWLCLGDALFGGPQPRETAERLQELGCPVVLGNADAFILDEGRRAEGLPLPPDHMWTLEQIGTDGVEFVRTFTPTVEFDLGAAGRLLGFHGGPDSYDTIIAPRTPPDILRNALGPLGTRTMCGGHIHQQWSVHLDGWAFFNPGSVGLAYNFYLPPDQLHFTAEAEFAILHVDDDRVAVEFLRVPFDVDAFDRAAKTNGHPDPELARRFPHPPA